MGDLTLAQGRLFGAITESALFGINFVLFLVISHLFLKEKRWDTGKRIRFTAIIVIFILCTIHLAAVIRGVQLAFFGDTPPDVFYSNRALHIDLTQKGVYAVGNVLADGLLIHRTYVIFGRNWIAISIPCLFLASTAGLWMALINVYSKSPPGITLYYPTIARLALAAFVASLITNILITAMVIIRIIYAIRLAKSIGTSSRLYSQVIAYSIESGLLYAICLLIMGVLYLLKDNGLEILSGSNMQVLGIVPTLLTLQKKLGLSIYDAATKTTSERVPQFPTLQFATPGTQTHSSMTNQEYTLHRIIGHTETDKNNSVVWSTQPNTLNQSSQGGESNYGPNKAEVV